MKMSSTGEPSLMGPSEKSPDSPEFVVRMNVQEERLFVRIVSSSFVCFQNNSFLSTAADKPEQVNLR
jgi:hypothetical protein